MARSARPPLIDAHVHVWALERFSYGWLQPGTGLYRDFLLEHVAEEMRACSVQGGLLVEAANTTDEIPWLLDLARTQGPAWGVVGWVDLAAPDAARHIAHYARDPYFKGVRLNWLEPRADPCALRGAMQALQARGLTVEVLTQPAYLPDIAHTAAAHPDLMFILDHLGGATLDGTFLPCWQAGLKACAALPNIILKVSGAAAPVLVNAAVARVGPGRLLFGSNWPVCLQRGRYSETVRHVQAATARWSEAARRALFVENARRVYRLGSV